MARDELTWERGEEWRKLPPEERKRLISQSKRRWAESRKTQNEKGESVKSLVERLDEEERGKHHTAELFLKEVERYCRETGKFAEDFPVELKARLLYDYRGFTKAYSQDYSQFVSFAENIKREFSCYLSKARMLIR